MLVTAPSTVWARRLLPGVALLSALATGACASDGDAGATSPEPLRISGYSVSKDHELRAYLEWCGTGATLSADESAAEVVLTAFPGDRIEGDCQATATVVLDSAVGDREVIDVSTGDAVPVIR